MSNQALFISLPAHHISSFGAAPKLAPNVGQAKGLKRKSVYLSIRSC